MENFTIGNASNLIYWIIGIIVSSGLIEISPIKLNPWTWLLSPLRKAITGGIDKEVKDLKDDINCVKNDISSVNTKLDNYIVESEKEQALHSRQRILVFNDEITQKKEHSKEHYEDVLLTIDEYEKYCNEHPEFPNNRCLLAIENIKNHYNEIIK